MSSKEINVLKRWDYENLSEYGFIIHAVRYNTGELFQRPAEEVFATWDIMSCSLIDATLCLQSIDATGFILKVPKQNILGTHKHDIWFPNHKGKEANARYASKTERNGSLVKSLHSGINKKGINIGNFRQLLMPGDLINGQMACGAKYNEILIAGRPFVNVYAGLPATRKIKVIGVFNFASSNKLASNQVFNSLAMKNPNVERFRTSLELKALQRKVTR